MSIKSFIASLFGGAEEIVSLEKLTLRTGGMRICTVREIVMKDGAAEVTLYEERHKDGAFFLEPVKRAVCEASRVTELLNDCRLISWDGFAGKHPRGVKDGTTFSLEATVNGGRKISAHGSQNFPKRYRILTDGIRNILESGDATG